MSSPTTYGQVLGLNALGVAGTTASGSHKWLIGTCLATLVISGSAYGMSWWARHIR